MAEKRKDGKGKTIFNVSKSGNFSEWFTEIIKRAELADVRYNVKGFVVFQPWSVLAMEKMYYFVEKRLREKGHFPYFFPTVIPEGNLKKESRHVKGFTPEVFWLDKVQGEERLALRPTSETAFYQMFSLWIRSHNDLPFKTYQRANVFRHETKATRPFLRSREFHWVEAHCAHASREDALKQVQEDMETTKEVLHDVFGLPFIFFERPFWDKFPGAEKTFAADVLNPDGKVVQQPSTHLLESDFAKAFDVRFMDRDGKEKPVWITCYGPAISRIFSSVVAVHGDDKGLRFPWKIAPIQVIITTIGSSEEILKEAERLKEELGKNGIDVMIDSSDSSPGEKFYYWEMKGVPLRIELGQRELKGKLTIYRRDTGEKDFVEKSDLMDYVEKTSEDIDGNLTRQADRLFENSIVTADGREEIGKAIEEGKIARCGFCSVGAEGSECAEVIEKEIGARVRGKNLMHEDVSGDCILCGRKAREVVYVARDY